MSKTKTIEKAVLAKTPSELGVTKEGHKIAVVTEVEEVKSELTPQETAELKAFEETISSESRSFVKVGRALRCIDEKKLYRGTFSSFEDYCPRKWGFTDKHAYRLIRGSVVFDALEKNSSPFGEGLPANEAQVRPLTELKPTRWVPVWKKVLKKAGKQPITEKLVTEVVEQEEVKAPAGLEKKSKKANPKAVAKAKLKQVSGELKGLVPLLVGSEYSKILKLLDLTTEAINEYLETLSTEKPA